MPHENNDGFPEHEIADIAPWSELENTDVNFHIPILIVEYEDGRPVEVPLFFEYESIPSGKGEMGGYSKYIRCFLDLDQNFSYLKSQSLKKAIKSDIGKGNSFLNFSTFSGVFGDFSEEYVLKRAKFGAYKNIPLESIFRIISSTILQYSVQYQTMNNPTFIESKWFSDSIQKYSYNKEDRISSEDLDRVSEVVESWPEQKQYEFLRAYPLSNFLVFIDFESETKLRYDASSICNKVDPETDVIIVTLKSYIEHMS